MVSKRNIIGAIWIVLTNNVYNDLLAGISTYGLCTADVFFTIGENVRNLETR